MQSRGAILPEPLMCGALVLHHHAQGVTEKFLADKNPEKINLGVVRGNGRPHGAAWQRALLRVRDWQVTKQFSNYHHQAAN